MLKSPGERRRRVAATSLPSRLTWRTVSSASPVLIAHHVLDDQHRARRQEAADDLIARPARKNLSLHHRAAHDVGRARPAFSEAGVPTAPWTWNEPGASGGPDDDVTGVAETCAPTAANL